MINVVEKGEQQSSDTQVYILFTNPFNFLWFFVRYWII